jgi:hypothetical protein
MNTVFVPENEKEKEIVRYGNVSNLLSKLLRLANRGK